MTEIEMAIARLEAALEEEDMAWNEYLRLLEEEV